MRAEKAQLNPVSAQANNTTKPVTVKDLVKKQGKQKTGHKLNLLVK